MIPLGTCLCGLYSVETLGGRRVGVRSTLTVEPLHDRVDGREGQGGEDALSVHTLIKDIVCGGDLKVEIF